MDARLSGAAPMYARLNGAAHAGDTNGLYDCIRDDVDVLRCIDMAEFVDTPLHIAAARGHTNFAKAIMYLKPSLGWKLNQDFFRPLHLALQNDHKETVLRLLAIDKNLTRVKGKEGYTPFHHAVKEGKLDLLAQFLKDCPTCIEDVTIRDESALHIAAQNNRFDALEILVELIWRSPLYGKIFRKQLLNLKDRDGNTVLHIAVANIQPQMIKLLLENNVDTKETNMSGLIALNILENQTRSDNKDESLNILHKFESGLSRFKAFLPPPILSKRWRSNFKSNVIEMTNSISSMSLERLNALLVALTLILATTYQAMINPPGGVWQGELSANLTQAYMVKVGRSVMDETSFNLFYYLNLLAFSYACLLTIGLLQIATRSRILTGLIAALMSFLMSSLYVSGNFIKPSDLPGREGITRLNSLFWSSELESSSTFIADLSFGLRVLLFNVFLMQYARKCVTP